MYGDYVLPGMNNQQPKKQPTRQGSQMPTYDPNKLSKPLTTGGDTFGKVDYGEGGYYKAQAAIPKKTTGYQWAQQQYSPDYLKNVGSMYDLLNQNIQNIPNMAGQWQQYQPTNLAEQYQQFMGELPSIEQEQYNRAMSRLGGAMGTAEQNLSRRFAGMRGGQGAMAGNMADLQRQYMSGAGEIATQQAMKNVADRENRMGQYLGLQGQDWGNRQGWLQGLTGAMGNDWTAQQQALGGMSGWLGQQMPYEQFNIQTPRNWAQQEASARAAARAHTEQVNAQRRAESQGWFDRMVGLDKSGAGQYYQGQGDYLGYQGQRGDRILGGYDPRWQGWANY